MKVDPYHHKARWLSWRSKNCHRIGGISKLNSDVVLAFLFDMEVGSNVNPHSKLGARSYIRLNSLKQHMIFFARSFKKNLEHLTENDVIRFFHKLRTGEITREDGDNYKDVGGIVKDFKAFWSWMVRTKRTEKDITAYLSRSDGTKPAWVYTTHDEFCSIVANYAEHLRELIWLMYDSGMRVTEANSIRVMDFENDFSILNISHDISKTFGRKIRLTFSRQHIKRFIRKQRLKPDDRIFLVSPSALNKNLRRAALRALGDAVSPARERYSKFTLYDIRHNSACYWAKRYKTTKGLMYRFGWKRESQALYYHEFLGFSDEVNTMIDEVKLQDLSKKLDFIISVIPKLQNAPQIASI